VVELGQDAPAERRVVDIAQNYVEYGEQEERPNLSSPLPTNLCTSSAPTQSPPSSIGPAAVCVII
jgi:hypothetical protein